MEETSDEQWEKYKNKVDKKLKENHLREQILKAQTTQEENSEKEVKQFWNILENLLIRTAFNSLKVRLHKKRIQPKNIIHHTRQELGFQDFNNYFRACKIKRKWNKVGTNLRNTISENTRNDVV